MKRRDFLQSLAGFGGYVALNSALAQTIFIQDTFGQSVPVDGLKRRLDPLEAIVLIPSDAAFVNNQISFNKRVTLTPAVRVLCLKTSAVAICLDWAQSENVPLAMRAGGHSFEGFSQSTGLVIDVRQMDSIEMSSDGRQVSFGAGAIMGKIYETLAVKGVTIPAGSCPTVGITGHATGGGYGLLARPFGLACDSLTDVEIVTADGRATHASETENADLFWACRGGGGGSFGVITRLGFQTHPLQTVLVFNMSWRVNQLTAARLAKAWQQWIANAPHEITSLLKIAKEPDASITVHIYGQSIGSEKTLRAELAVFTMILAPGAFAVQQMPLIGAVRHFAGPSTYPSVYMKGKSDYVKTVMTDQGLSELMKGLPIQTVAVIFDGYGGAINQKKEDETAFAHRAGTIASMQYYSQWIDPKLTPFRLAQMRTYYDSLRPYVSGSNYINYPDLDLKNWAEAYWGGNLDRLIQIKNVYDSKNLFRHAQSVPLSRT